jgi:lipopolysaccharide transport protein LptA
MRAPYIDEVLREASRTGATDGDGRSGLAVSDAAAKLAGVPVEFATARPDLVTETPEAESEPAEVASVRAPPAPIRPEPVARPAASAPVPVESREPRAEAVAAARSVASGTEAALAPAPAKVEAADAEPPPRPRPLDPAPRKSPRAPEEAEPDAARSAPTEVAATSPRRGGFAFPGIELSASGSPVDITSDRLSLDYEAKSVVFSGRVRAVQATGTITSDVLRVSYGESFNDVKEMVAEGNVRISQGTRWATGEHAVLDQTKRTVVLTGNPVVHDGRDQITGRKITVFLDSGRSVVEGARAVIFPRGSSSADNEAPSRGAP